eukprot:2450944-Prymnesium_polylepis.1
MECGELDARVPQGQAPSPRPSSAGRRCFINERKLTCSTGVERAENQSRPDRTGHVADHGTA